MDIHKIKKAAPKQSDLSFYHLNSLRLCPFGVKLNNFNDHF